MTAANGTDRAARRRVINNTSGPSGLGAGHEALAQVIGVAVAQALAPMLAQLAPQKTACAYCAGRRKLAIALAEQALAEQQAEYEIVCKAAAELGDTPPEFTPKLPELPPVQEMFTWLPVVAAAGYPPCSVPVCFDDMPTEVAAPAEPAEPPKPALRPTGLVDPVTQRPIFAPNVG